MKKNMRAKIFLAMLSLVALLQAVVSTVSAKAIGEGYLVMGYNAGWVFILIGAVAVLLVGVKLIKIPSKNGKTAYAIIFGGLLVVGLAMVFVETPTATVTGDPADGLQYTVEATALVTDGTYYPDTTYDKSAKQFTIPYRADDDNDLIREHGTANTTYNASDRPALQFVVSPILEGGETDADIGSIYYEVTNPSVYADNDPDNYILNKIDEEYQAWWVDEDSKNSTLSGTTSGNIEDTTTLVLTLDLREAGLSQQGELDPIFMNLKIWNQDNTWSETYTIQFVATVYWDG